MRKTTSFYGLLADTEVEFIRLFPREISNVDISRMFGVSNQLISNIRNYKVRKETCHS